MKKIILILILLSINVYASKEVQVDLKGKLVNYNFHYKDKEDFRPVTIT
jgi:hypothetical protein